MARVIVQSKKGSFLVPEEKHFGDFDLPFHEGSLRGSERQTVSNLPEKVEVSEFVPLATLIRVKREGTTYDILKLPFEIAIPIGEVKEVREDKEAYYKESLVGKSLEEVVIEKGIDLNKFTEELIDLKDFGYDYLVGEDVEVGEAIEELIEKAEKGTLTYEDLKEKIPFLWEKVGKRAILTTFPSLRTTLRLKTTAEEVKSGITPPLTLKELLQSKEVEREEFHLNGIMVGTDREGNVRIIYSPSRVEFRSSLQVLKTLNQSPLFKFANYAQGISEKKFKEDPEYREKVEKKLKELAPETKDATVKELVEKVLKGESIRKNAQKIKKVFLESYFKENLKDLISLESLLAKKDDKLFLRTKPSNYGYPFLDYSKVEKVAITEVPRPVKIEGKMTIQKVPTVISALSREGDKLKPVALKTDVYALKRSYPIYKVLKMIKESKSIAQVRALTEKGFESIKGLERLKEELGKNKNAVNYLEFIEHLKTVLSPFVYEKDEKLKEKYGSLEKALEEVKKAVEKDPLAQEFFRSFNSFLKKRGEIKLYDLSNYFKDPKNALTFLLSRGIVEQKDGKYQVNKEKASKVYPLLKKNYLKEGVKPSLALLALASTLNGALLLKEEVPEIGKENAKEFAQMLKEALFYKEVEDKKHFLKELSQPETTEETVKETVKEGEPKEEEEWTIPSEEEIERGREEFLKEESEKEVSEEIAEEINEEIEEVVEEEVSIEGKDIEDEIEEFEELVDKTAFEIDF